MNTTTRQPDARENPYAFKALAGIVFAALAVLALAACQAQPAEEPAPTDEAPATADATADANNPAEATDTTQATEPADTSTPVATVDELVATLEPATGSEVRGEARFSDHPDGVAVTVDVSGLEPDSTHGIHIHEQGNCAAPDASSAGGHLNPAGNDHGLPPETPRHAGDLGNLEADASGNASFEITVYNVSLIGESDPGIAGRALIVHATADDGGQPSGGAGDRIACGIIQVADSASMENN